ncbi:hypothetical protein HKCCSP123_03140 [Rhodobacterales bacterium HKCCSP123]|nr:hypothetical protein [Rhodobacterales bacterium HKCCSP123]
MELQATLIVLALVAAWAGIGYWANTIGRSPMVWVLVAVFGSPVLAILLLLVIGPTPERKEALLEAARNRQSEEDLAARQKVIAERREQLEKQADDAAYAHAWNELKSGQPDPTAIARATAESNGDRDKAEAIYLKLRVPQIRDGMEVPAPDLSDLEALPVETSKQIDVIDASGQPRTLTRLDDGQFEARTITGERKLFMSIEDARRYFRG